MGGPPRSFRHDAPGHPRSEGFLGTTLAPYAARVDDLLHRVERLCAADLDATGLREQVVAALRARIPYDGHLFAFTDPRTMVLSSPHATVPMLPWERLPELIRWRHLSTVHRIDTLAGGPTRRLDPAWPLWQHVLRSLGVVDTLTLVLADRFGTWGMLELWRTSDPFAEADATLLDRLGPILTLGVRRCVARTFEDAEQVALPGPAVIVLDDGLRVRDQTTAADEALRRLLPPDEAMAPVPAAAYNAGAALVAQEAGVPLGEPFARVHLGGGRWLAVRASRLGADIVVSLEPATAAQRLDLYARAIGLSPRETEVLELLAIGLDTGEIAGQLFLSEHTVNDHVKAALGKAGVHTRPRLLARIAGPAVPV